jgi:hypothetical protein
MLYAPLTTRESRALTAAAPQGPRTLPDDQREEAAVRPWWRRVLKDKKGNVLVVAAAALPLFVGAAGLAVDTIHLSVAKRQLQRAADSGALAAAYAIAAGNSHQDAVTADVDQRNRIISLSQAPTIERGPAGTEWAGDDQAVRVRLAAERPTPFMGFFIAGSQELIAEATARVFGTGQYCVISLYDGTDSGIVVSGNADVALGCGMATNARGSQAVTAGGSSSVSASPIAAMGNIPSSNRFAPGTQLQPFSVRQQDPLGHVPNPPAGFCSTPLGAMANQPNATSSFSPGCYSEIDLKGTATLQPGVYYVNGGDVSFGSQANVTGNNVVIVMTGTNGNAGDFKINGGATLNLTAPTSGPHRGVAFYRDRRAPVIDIKMNGGGNFNIRGAFYMPTADIDMLGNFDMSADCLQIVGRILTFKGTADLRNNCPANSGAGAFTGTTVRLVG